MLLRQMQGWLLLLQCGAVPLPQLRGGVVGALREVEEDLIRLFSGAHRIVRKYEFVQLGFIKTCVWLNFRLRESRRFRVRVGVEDWRRCGGVPGPKTQAAHFLRIRLARDLVRQVRDPARMWRSRSTGKTRYCKIKTAPEKMHRAAFATETRAKVLKHAIALHEHPPEPVRIFGIV